MSKGAKAGRAVDGVPLLPSAISTLRTKRSRPMRLIGDAGEQRWRKPASSSGARSARRGAVSSARGRKAPSRARVRELVPRADGEAVVAAIDAVAHAAAELARDRALVLDREIGDAAPRIELVGRRKGVASGRRRGRPGRAAMVGLGRVGRQLERGEDLAEEQPGAELARHQVGVLALPADAGAPRPAASPSPARCRRRP